MGSHKEHKEGKEKTGRGREKRVGHKERKEHREGSRTLKRELQTGGGLTLKRELHTEGSR